MPFTVVDSYHGAVITVSGKFLGSQDGPVLKEALDALKGAGKRRVVVDLAQAEFMDSSAVGALISGVATMRKAGGDVRLASMGQRVRNIFVITRLLGPVFTSYDSVDAALDSFKLNPPAENIEA